MNVGRMAGGHSKNTVPDRVEAQVDLRFQTRIGRRAARSRRSSRRRRGGRVRAGNAHRASTEESPGAPLERTEASARLCAEYGACARVHGLGAEEAPLIGGGSDASTAAALGIPAIDGLGPRGSGFHTKDERIELASLVPKAQALARFLAQRAIG